MKFQGLPTNYALTMIPHIIKYTDDMPAWMGGYAHGQT
jgi:hypothetical protein